MRSKEECVRFDVMWYKAFKYINGIHKCGLNAIPKSTRNSFARNVDVSPSFSILNVLI